MVGTRVISSGELYCWWLLTLSQKRFRQIDMSNIIPTDPCTGYVQILYHLHLNVT